MDIYKIAQRFERLIKMSSEQSSEETKIPQHEEEVREDVDWMEHTSRALYEGIAFSYMSRSDVLKTLSKEYPEPIGSQLAEAGQMLATIQKERNKLAGMIKLISSDMKDSKKIKYISRR